MQPRTRNDGGREQRAWVSPLVQAVGTYKPGDLCADAELDDQSIGVVSHYRDRIGEMSLA